ncbi:dynein regulatory complex protein 9 isoform X3 [Cavia porcellus]|uniref:dynein regulatory complex protein 9 isoform X3 n=1 Tax=Cavia porcellus TaxID=10141 RepID=UPI002FDFAE05
MAEDSGEASPVPSEAWPEGTLVTEEPPGAATEEAATPEAPESEAEEAAAALSLLEVLRVCAVLEDAGDQLSILGCIMPWPLERRQSAAAPVRARSNSPDKPPVPSTARKTSIPSSLKAPASPEVRPRGQLAAEVNKMQDLAFKTSTGQAIMTMETLKKTQSDREESGRKMIKTLQKQLINVKKERQAEVQSRNEYIAHLKDQLQEMKAKTNLENHYMKRNTELQVAQTQRKCNRTEELLLEEIEKLRMKTEEENRIHVEIEMFLKKEQQVLTVQLNLALNSVRPRLAFNSLRSSCLSLLRVLGSQRLEEKLEFWMEKFDKDTEMKQNKLNALKATKASDLAHLQDLAKTIREYEQVIIEDRIEKEKTRKKIKQDVLELKSAIKLQAWWRGTVVRKEIGGFKMPKKEMEDSKDMKGKGMDKQKRRGKK